MFSLLPHQLKRSRVDFIFIINGNSSGGGGGGGEVGSVWGGEVELFGGEASREASSAPPLLR